MTAEELAAAVAEIQDALAATLKTAVPKAVVRNRWVMSTNRAQWAGLLESADDQDEAGKNKVHAITVAFVGLQMPEARAQELQSISLQPTFAIDFFYQYDSGNDKTNSEQQVRIDTVAGVFALWQNSALGNRALVKGHTQLQMPPTFDVIPLGGKLVHQASGTITVLMQPQQAS